MSSALSAPRPARTRLPESAGVDLAGSPDGEPQRPEQSRQPERPGEPEQSRQRPGEPERSRKFERSGEPERFREFEPSGGSARFRGFEPSRRPAHAREAQHDRRSGRLGGPGSRSDLSGRAVVVLHAHPDDESIFTAATMRRLADRGARVVLVMATGGELGERLAPLRPGESVHRRRLAELEAAAGLLGVSRLVLLGRRDSGMAGWPSARHPRALARGRTDQLARRLADVLDAERADTVVHYDDRGIYGHPDHVAVHRIGALAATMTGAAAYQATVDRDHLRGRGGAHLIDAASGHTGDYGKSGHEIAVRLTASDAELAAKRAAMAAHASQIPPAAVGGAGFADTYRHEWYLTSDRNGILTDLH